jgi:hypothetical protein
MPLTDRYGLPLSTPSAGAAQTYVEAVDNVFAAGANLVTDFEAALAQDPGFALAEIGRSAVVQGGCDCLPVLDDWRPAEPRQET